MDYNSLVGDVPVSEQIGAALERMASKEHTHDQYATVQSVEELERKIEMLYTLVGDVSVSDQIAMAFKNIK